MKSKLILVALAIVASHSFAGMIFSNTVDAFEKASTERFSLEMPESFQAILGLDGHTVAYRGPLALYSSTSDPQKWFDDIQIQETKKIELNILPKEFRFFLETNFEGIHELEYTGISIIKPPKEDGYQPCLILMQTKKDKLFYTICWAGETSEKQLQSYQK